MNSKLNTQYHPCPVCTYPLSKCMLGTEKDKNGVLKEVVRTYCTNNSCPEHYEKIIRRKAKWQ